MQTRRGFLKLFAGLVASSATEAVFGKETLSAITPKRPPVIPYKEIIWSAYFPFLKQNEGEKLNFYKCSGNKVTIGYGTNAESHINQLKDIPIYYKNKALSKTDKTSFLNKSKEKTPKDLKNYSISRQSAEQLAKSFTCQAIQNLIDIFKKEHFTFIDLPLPMQILALDIYYNVGKAGFLKYKNFRKALKRKDYKTAIAEGKVKTGNGFNKDRERRKTRLLTITEIRRTHPQDSFQKTKELVEQSYRMNTPKLTQILIGKTDKATEEAILLGDFNFEKSKRTLLTSNLSQNTKYV